MPVHLQAENGARREALRAEVREALTQTRSLPSQTLEIGCGHGHFLVAYAAAHPDEACFGVDFSGSRIERATRKVATAGLENARFFHGPAEDFLAVLESAVRFRQVFVLFPDPWPKRRHHKNRLINASFLATLATFSSPDAELFFRTDHLDYFSAAERVIHFHPDWTLQDTDPSAAWPFEHPTVFQAKASQHYSSIAVRTARARQ